MKNYLRLLTFLKPYIWPRFTLAMIFMLFYSGTSGAIPFLAKTVFDDVFSSKDQVALAILPFVIIGIFALRGLMSFGESYLMSYIGGRIVTDIRNKLNGQILSFSLSCMRVVSVPNFSSLF